MITANQAQMIAECLALEYVTYSAPQSVSALCLMRTATDYWSTWSRVIGLKYAVDLSWSASSGSGDWTGVGDWRNDYTQEWDSGGDNAYRGGCIPRTATTAAVEVDPQFHPGRSQERHAVVSTAQEQPSQGEWEGMTVYEDWSGEGVEAVQYKFPIYNAASGSEFSPADGVGDSRGTGGRLLIHPDGGEVGTVGCIGVQASATARGHGAEEVRCILAYRCRGLVYPLYWDQDANGVPRNAEQFDVLFRHALGMNVAVPLFIVGDGCRTDLDTDCLDDFISIVPLP